MNPPSLGPVAFTFAVQQLILHAEFGEHLLQASGPFAGKTISQGLLRKSNSAEKISNLTPDHAMYGREIQYVDGSVLIKRLIQQPPGDQFPRWTPICRALSIAPSTCYDRRAIVRDPERASRRAKSDAALSLRIDAAWDDNRKLYGARNIWQVLRREGEDVARSTVERLMRALGIRGVVRGKKVITTNPDRSQPCPDD